MLSELTEENPDKVTLVSGKENLTLTGGETVVIDETSAKISITASTGNNTIVSKGEKVFVSLRGGKTDIYAVGGKMTVAGYNPASGRGFHTDYEDIFATVNDGEIIFDEGKLTIGSAVVVDDDNNAVVNLFNAVMT